MTTRLAAALGLVASLALASEALAVPIPATDLDAWLTGGETQIGGTITDDFTVSGLPLCRFSERSKTKCCSTVRLASTPTPTL